MGLSEQLLNEATLYLQIVGGFSFVQSGIMTIVAVLRSHSFTKDVMYVTIGMNVLNVIGNYLLWRWRQGKWREMTFASSYKNRVSLIYLKSINIVQKIGSKLRI